MNRSALRRTVLVHLLVLSLSGLLAAETPFYSGGYAQWLHETHEPTIGPPPPCPCPEQGSATDSESWDFTCECHLMCVIYGGDQVSMTHWNDGILSATSWGQTWWPTREQRKDARAARRACLNQNPYEASPSPIPTPTDVASDPELTTEEKLELIRKIPFEELTAEEWNFIYSVAMEVLDEVILDDPNGNPLYSADTEQEMLWQALEKALGEEIAATLMGIAL